MTAALAILAAINVFVLLWVLWILSNIRDAIEKLREPTLDKWLQEHPERPHKHDPPAGRAPG